jgi:pimeloyl-ACP methyl ester carboxylesterase
MKVAHLAEAWNLPVTSHGAHDITVHLLAAAPNRSYLEVHGFGLERFLAQPLRIEDGFALAPDRPGHGRSPDVRQDFESEAHLIADQLLDEPAHLVGYSYGAIVAMLAATRAGVLAHGRRASGDERRKGDSRCGSVGGRDAGGLHVRLG